MTTPLSVRTSLITHDYDWEDAPYVERCASAATKSLKRTTGSVCVMQAWVDGRAVAVKMWCGGDEIMRKVLKHEIQVYLHIAKYGASLLGQVLPALHAVCVRNDDTVGFVTEHVGHRVLVGIDGTPSVDGQELTAQDVVDVQEAAIKALRRLHRLGVVHGDVHLRKMRVERRENEWKVWWVDFELARIASGREKRDGEIATFVDRFQGLVKAGL